MDISEEITKLNDLKKSGAMTEEEFQKAKKSLLDKNQSTSEKIDDLVGDLTNEKTWSMFIHLSQFCGYFVVPVAGLVVPIILWQLKKNESEFIDNNGKIVTNWIISAFIYSIVGYALVFILIGLLILPILAILAIVFPIIGALKANDGVLWEYPLSIKFFPINKK